MFHQRKLLPSPAHRYPAVLISQMAGHGKSFDVVALDAVQRMERAGFQIEAVDGSLRVKPAERLSDQQRLWLRSHKAELLIALAIRADPYIAELVALFGAAIVKVGPLDILPHSPPVDTRKRCADCCHSRSIEGDEPEAIQRCTVSDSGIGYFANQLHCCELWIGKPALSTE